MAKPKKRKRIDSDAVCVKKNKVETKKLNPFEVHINKEKFKILGRKCKHDRGLPGIARSKAIQKRKQTLGKEYQELHKVNKFKDRRIGSGVQIDDDKIANDRFTAEKLGQFKTKRSDLFNLNDDEVLTHRGQTLEEIEQFIDPVSDESEDEELDAEFTEATHFGGGDGKVDRKALIEEKIIEAKRKKAEILKEKEEIHEKTVKLDSDYKEILSVIGKMKRTEDEPKPKPDDYDRALREMIFEPRGEVTDKLKSEDEIAKKEKERLQKLEKERLKRMLDEETLNENNKPKHKSADDLDDGYLIDNDEEQDDGTLAYELEDKVELAKSDVKQSEEENDTDDENRIESNSVSDDEEEEEDEQDEDEEDDLRDLKQDETESENEGNVELEEPNVSEKSIITPQRERNPKQQSIDNLLSVYDIPRDYEVLKMQLCTNTPENQAIIVERTLKSNHPKLDPMNQEKILQLFVNLLKYIDDVFNETDDTNIQISFKIFGKLSPFIYDMVKLNPKSSQCLLDFIIFKYSEYKKNPKQFPKLGTIMIFKLISSLYSTSDFRHSIVTPCFIFMSHILSRAKIRTRCDSSFGLLIVTILLEYTRLSKRILPAAFNYLLGVLYLCINKKSIEVYKIMPPFSLMDSLNNMLVITEEANTYLREEDSTFKSIDLVSSQIDDDFKIRTLNTTLKLITDVMENIEENVGARYYAESFESISKKLDLTLYPDFVKQNYEKLSNTLTSIMNKSLQRLVPAEKKPRSLRLMEPRIEKVVDDKRRPKMSKEKEERAILLHKIKRETKGAVREIRRDTEFINKMRIKKQIQSDLERKEKVQRIYAEAADQQGELNALERKRKKL